MHSCHVFELHGALVFAFGNFQPKYHARKNPALTFTRLHSLLDAFCRIQLTVWVFTVHTAYPAIREHLQVKPNAHVAVQPPHSFDALQVVALPVQLRSAPVYTQIGAGEKRLPLPFYQSGVSPVRGRERGSDCPQRSPQNNNCWQRPVRLGPAAHAVVTPLRNGHPVYLWGTWLKLPALKKQLFLSSVLWHVGDEGSEFVGQSRSGPHGPRSERVENRTRRSLDWCRWRWPSFAAPRLCTGNAGRGGGAPLTARSAHLAPYSLTSSNDITVTSALRAAPPLRVGGGRRRVLLDLSSTSKSDWSDGGAAPSHQP